MRRKVKITSSAFISRVGVKYGVLWNLTPRRSVKVKVFASGVICQPVASSGFNCVVPRTKPTRPLKSCDVTLLVLVLSHRLGSKP